MTGPVVTEARLRELIDVILEATQRAGPYITHVTIALSAADDIVRMLEAAVHLVDHETVFGDRQRDLSVTGDRQAATAPATADHIGDATGMVATAVKPSELAPNPSDLLPSDVGAFLSRDAVLAILALWLKPDHVRLSGGEHTAQEMRSVLAVVGAIDRQIRALPVTSSGGEARDAVLEEVAKVADANALHWRGVEAMWSGSDTFVAQAAGKRAEPFEIEAKRIRALKSTNRSPDDAA